MTGVSAGPTDTPLRVLLTEDASPSAREMLTVLGWAGHHVEALSSGGLGLTRLSRFVRRRHRVPVMSDDLRGYVQAVQRVLTAGDFDVLLPTHEQVAVLARYADQLDGLVRTLPVPSFAAVARLQDKAQGTRLMADLGVPQPPTDLLDSVEELRSADLPCWVKLPMATASSGVWRAGTRSQLQRIARHPYVLDTLDRGSPVLVQAEIEGTLLTVSSAFTHGVPRASHAIARRRPGIHGSAAVKEAVPAPEVHGHLARLGSALDWHGGLSADIIIDADGAPFVIDVNPRLVEPVPAWLDGLNLLAPLLDGGKPTSDHHLPTTTTGGLRTSIMLLGLLEHARAGATRRDLAREIAAALRRTGPYAGTVEELLPVRHDPLPGLLLAMVAIALLIRPSLWRRVAPGANPRNALTPAAWHTLVTGP